MFTDPFGDGKDISCLRAENHPLPWVCFEAQFESLRFGKQFGPTLGFLGFVLGSLPLLSATLRNLLLLRLRRYILRLIFRFRWRGAISGRLLLLLVLFGGEGSLYHRFWRHDHRHRFQILNQGCNQGSYKYSHMCGYVSESIQRFHAPIFQGTFF